VRVVVVLKPRSNLSSLRVIYSDTVFAIHEWSTEYVSSIG
jgi:hypothetical protein